MNKWMNGWMKNWEHLWSQTNLEKKSKRQHHGYFLHCPLQFQSDPFANDLGNLKQSRNVLTPTQDSFCLVQIKEERLTSPTTVAWFWILRRYLDIKHPIVPSSVAVHGQRCVLHIILQEKENDINAYTYVYTVILKLLPFLYAIQLNFRNHFVIRQQIITF